MAEVSACSCIVKNNELIVFDEATSAIDPIEESLILKELLNFSKDKTSIIITHRLSICAHVDKILYLDAGKIKAYGTHEALFNNCLDYHNYYQKQAELYR